MEHIAESIEATNQQAAQLAQASQQLRQMAQQLNALLAEFRL
ncbi:methyl-accepting chemotaxis protein [Alishewanella longhuensis]